MQSRPERWQQGAARHSRASRLRLVPRRVVYLRPQAAGCTAHDAKAAPAEKFAAVVLQSAKLRRLTFAELPQPRKLLRQFQPGAPPAALFAHATARGITTTSGWCRRSTTARPHEGTQFSRQPTTNACGRATAATTTTATFSPQTTLLRRVRGSRFGTSSSRVGTCPRPTRCFVVPRKVRCTL